LNWGVVVFPGSNCDRDTIHALDTVLGQPVRSIWHRETSVGEVDCVVLPGGFAHGDYLRAGAIARFSPVMAAVAAHAKAGGLVLGICNGFQVLQEAGLLPGAMLPNRAVQFRCEWVHVRVESPDTPYTMTCDHGQVLRLPIAHGVGNFTLDEAGLDRIEAGGEVLFRYCAPDGSLEDSANPNGSARHIAGICNSKRNVCALMPHPERACEVLVGGLDGRLIFESLIATAGSAMAVGA
jgi:phosphoribosylformylglycinamidine synthase